MQKGGVVYLPIASAELSSNRLEAPPPEVASHLGLVMVKPHAVACQLDTVIETILQTGEPSFSSDTILEVHPYLGNVVAQSALPRNLLQTSYGDQLIDFFYRDKADRPYFPLIKKFYLGKVVLLPFFFNGSKKEFGAFNNALKGATMTLKEDGSLKQRPHGIRGLLGEPYIDYEKSTLASLDSDDYESAVSPVIQNYIHVCEKDGEAETALSVVVS